jgi:hypothetical protein
MLGKVIKKKNGWFVEYLEGLNKVLMPLHPSELKIEGLSKLKNKEIEFESKKEYLGFRYVGEKDQRAYIDVYQNYAKLKIK